MERQKAGRTLQTGISSQYVKDWTTVQAIREVIQNNLDIRGEHQVGGDIRRETEGRVVVQDFGPGLEMRHLAMGISEKGPDSIGQFGEGLKLALLVLAREGRNPAIESNGKVIRPLILYSKDYDTDVLAFLVKDSDHLTLGTIVTFDASAEELDKGKSYFTALDTSIRWVEKDKISLPGGSIYVNGAKVAALENALFSYHVKGEESRDILNRDRSTVDNGKVSRMVVPYLRYTNDQVIDAVMQALASKTATWETTYCPVYYADGDAGKKWLGGWVRKFGKSAVLTGSRDAIAEYQGYNVVKSIPWQWADFFHGVGVQHSHEVVKDTRRRSAIPLKDLTVEEYSSLVHAKAIVERFYVKPCEVKIAEDLDEGSDAEGTTMGLFTEESGTDMIWLRRDILCDRVQTLHVLLHETVHMVSGETDMTAGFQRALLNVSVNMIVKEVGWDKKRA